MKGTLNESGVEEKCARVKKTNMRMEVRINMADSFDRRRREVIEDAAESLENGFCGSNRERTGRRHIIILA